MSTIMQRTVRKVQELGWEVSASDRERVEFHRRVQGELLIATVNIQERWWTVGGSDRAPTYVDCKQGLGGRGYAGQGWPERMVADAVQGVNQAAGVSDEG